MGIGKMITSMVGISAMIGLTAYVDANDLTVRLGQRMIGAPYVEQVADSQVTTIEEMYSTYPEYAEADGIHGIAEQFYTRHAGEYPDDILSHCRLYMDDKGVEDALELFQCIPEEYQYDVFWQTIADDMGIGRTRYVQLMNLFSRDGGE